MTEKTMDKMCSEAISIFSAGVKAVEAGEAVRRSLEIRDGILFCRCGSMRQFMLKSFNRIYVVGAGKATASMAVTIEDILGNKITDGVINVKYGHTAKLKRIRMNEAAHPVPDEKGMKGAEEIARLAGMSGRDDLVICLISGGGSALMPLPAKGVSLVDKQKTTDLLLASGASIHEVNCVRKHISAIKGGGLARMARPATMLTLIISDVTENDLSTIASGPTVPDSSTFDDAMRILRRYELTNRVPETVMAHIQRGCTGEIAETASPGDPSFNKVANCIIADNTIALNAAAKAAENLGYVPMVLTTSMEGEAREVAKVISSIAKESNRKGRPVNPPACLLSGGETTVTLHGSGKGGRNQELALAAAIALHKHEGIVILSCGTDGTDGPTDAAGAVAGWQTVSSARVLGLEAEIFLTENDSYTFFSKAGGIIKTGPTNTNVMDMIVALIK